MTTYSRMLGSRQSNNKERLGDSLTKRPQTKRYYSASKKYERTHCVNNSAYFHRQCKCSIKIRFSCECGCYTPSLFKKLISSSYTKLNKKYHKKEHQNIQSNDKITHMKKENKGKEFQMIRKIVRVYPPIFNPLHKVVSTSAPIFLQQQSPLLNSPVIWLTSQTTQRQPNIIPTFSSPQKQRLIPHCSSHSQQPLIKISPSVQNFLQKTSYQFEKNTFQDKASLKSVITEGEKELNKPTKISLSYLPEIIQQNN